MRNRLRLLALASALLLGSTLHAEDSIGITQIRPPLPWIVDASTTITVTVSYELQEARAADVSAGLYRVVLAGEPGDGPSGALPRSREVDSGVRLDSLSGTLQLSRSVEALVGSDRAARSVKVRAFLAQLSPGKSPNYVSRSAAVEFNVARGTIESRECCPAEARWFDGAIYWSSVLRPLGVPLPSIPAAGQHDGFEFLILERADRSQIKAPSCRHSSFGRS
jgi:hypothetical protein